MARQTREDKTNLYCEAWLLADEWGGLKLTRTRPRAGLGEVAISLMVTVPKVLFKRPALRAAITLPETPPMDPADAVKALTDLVERGCDFAVTVTIDPPGDDE